MELRDIISQGKKANSVYIVVTVEGRGIVGVYQNIVDAERVVDLMNARAEEKDANNRFTIVQNVLFN